MADSDKPEGRHEGLKFTVIHCNGALDSYIEALDHVKANRRKAFTRGMIQQMPQHKGES